MVFPRVSFLEMTERDWDHVLGVNLKGSCFCAQYVAKAMISAGRQGRIINIALAAALRGSPRGVHYVASKGGVLLLTRAMALELAPYRISVNAIAPGLTDTAQPRYGSGDTELADMARSIPFGPVALPEEIARAAVFTASENAGSVTGQTLHVNGRLISGVRCGGRLRRARATEL
jgi:NAD(P)-dependent dehydrogenase (short-subunit alcohol dehydrogenase family)